MLPCPSFDMKINEQTVPAMQRGREVCVCVIGGEGLLRFSSDRLEGSFAHQWLERFFPSERSYCTHFLGHVPPRSPPLSLLPPYRMKVRYEGCETSRGSRESLMGGGVGAVMVEFLPT